MLRRSDCSEKGAPQKKKKKKNSGSEEITASKK